MTTREIDAKLGHENSPINNDGLITLHGVALALRSNAWLIAGTIASAMALATIYLALAKPMFTAKSQLLIEPYRFANSQLDNGIAPILDNVHIEGQLVLLRSGRVANEVMARLGLVSDPEFCATLPGHEGANRTAGSTPLGEEDRAQCVVDELQKNLVVRRLQISSAIEVLYSSPNPDKARRVANTIAEVYLGNLANARADIARGRTEWLKGRIDGLRKLMNESVLAAQAFQAKRDYRLPEVIAHAGRNAAPAEGTTAADVARAVSLEELQADARTYSKMYEAFLEALTRSLQEQSFGGTEARIISIAERPLRPSSPRLLLTLGLALAFGAIAGVLIALVRSQLYGVGRS